MTVKESLQAASALCDEAHTKAKAEWGKEDKRTISAQDAYLACEDAVDLIDAIEVIG